MKRIVSLILAAAFVLGTFGAGMAADFKTTGEFAFGFQLADNEKFADEKASDFAALQRVRVQTVITASENVSGTLFFEIGDTNWGVKSEGGALGTDGTNIEVRRAYIDFNLPSTELAIRMGLQGVALPSAVANSPVLDDDAAAIVASYAFNDMFSATALWARPFAKTILNKDGEVADTLKTDDKFAQDSVDLFGAIVGVKGDGFSVSPYLLFANYNEYKKYGAEAPKMLTAGNEGEGYWVGVAAELNMFDPLTFGADVVYSTLEMDNDKADADGWFLAADASYKFDFLTAVFTTWYSTGVDGDDEGFTKISAGDFAPTSFGTDGGAFDLTDNIIGSEGNWGVALAAEDISFVEGLSHAVRFAYYNGTNERDASVATNFEAKDADKRLGDDDSAIEFNFDTHYAIYENLAADLQFGWARLDLENSKVDEEDAWRLGLGLTYNF